MSDPIVIDTPSGDQLVILPRADYDAMRARLADYEAAEDAADIVVGELALAEWEAQGRPSYPLAVVRLMREGRSPIAAFRRHRKLTKQALAEQAGLSVAELSKLEKGGQPAQPQVLTALAAALGTTAASLKAFDTV